MRQYEIWWADLPKPAERRPVLLLSRTSAYSYLNKFLVADITTTIRGIAQEVRIGKREGMKQSCAINFDNLRTVSSAALSKKAGELAPARHFEAKRALGHALGWIDLTDAP